MSASFGEALRAARDRRELSQEQLAEEAGLDPTVIAVWERGESTPGLDVLGVLGRVLGVSLPEMLEWYVPPCARPGQR